MSRWLDHLEALGILEEGEQELPLPALKGNDSRYANYLSAAPDVAQEPVEPATVLRQAIRQARDWQDLETVLARIIRELYRGDLAVKEAGTLEYLLTVLKGCLEDGQLEERVLELEKQLVQRNGKPVLQPLALAAKE